jgi:sugar/nucleoside kinase (ribokinase family)
MPAEPTNGRPDYLVLGHVTKDLLPDGSGYTPGGTVTYAALAARRLGLQAAIVTACAPEDEPLLAPATSAGIWVHSIASPKTTTFRNTYSKEGHRTQIIKAQAAPIGLENVPEAWLGSPIVHLGPVAQELPAGLAGAFTDCLLGITPQGWMRSWDADGQVLHSASPVPAPLIGLPRNAFLVLSIEDLGGDYELLQDYVKLSRLTAITHGGGSAYLCIDGACSRVPACSANVQDPTGAGDVFATALFVRYRETGDLIASASFAHAAAACNIEGPGTSGIPSRETVEERIKEMGIVRNA